MKHLQATRNRTITVLAPAKLNLTFGIVGKLSDGYHSLVSLMQTVDLCDTIDFHFSPADINEISLAYHPAIIDGDFPLDSANLIHKAAKSFWLGVPHLPPTNLAVLVQKKIPIAAGLAGGSADAAATLIALNNYFGQPLKHAQLLALGSELGADVPFSLSGGTCLATGRGEQLLPISITSTIYYVLIKPRTISISTAWAYKTFDQSNRLGHVDAAELEEFSKRGAKHFSNGDLTSASKILANCFEPIAFAHHPVLAKIKFRLLELGCLSAHMTGSGPTMYGLAKDKDQALQVLDRIELDQQQHTTAAWFSDYKTPIDAWVVATTNYGAKVIDNGNS